MNIEQLIESLKSQGLVNQAEIDAKVAEYKDKRENPTFSYDGLTLEEAKKQKMKELSFYCEKTILGYFQSTVGTTDYWFSNDNNAQKNFDKGETAFSKNYLTTMDWTAYDSNWNVVRLSLDTTTFEPIYRDHLNHIQSNIAKFRDTLMSKVEVAYQNEDLEGIKVVVW
jgi:hypothetical protein